MVQLIFFVLTTLQPECANQADFSLCDMPANQSPGKGGGGSLLSPVSITKVHLANFFVPHDTDTDSYEFGILR
jgi:hypothetical protein